MGYPPLPPLPLVLLVTVTPVPPAPVTETPPKVVPVTVVKVAPFTPPAEEVALPVTVTLPLPAVVPVPVPVPVPPVPLALLELLAVLRVVLPDVRELLDTLVPPPVPPVPEPDALLPFPLALLLLPLPLASPSGSISVTVPPHPTATHRAPRLTSFTAFACIIFPLHPFSFEPTIAPRLLAQIFSAHALDTRPWLPRAVPAGFVPRTLGPGEPLLAQRKPEDHEAETG
jgi:hypothetical protein